MRTQGKHKEFYFHWNVATLGEFVILFVKIHNLLPSLIQVHGLNCSCFMHLLLQFGCCGIDGVDDYLEAKKWDRNRTVEVQPGQNQDVYLETPFSCCKVQGTFPDVQPVEQECAVQPSEANSNKDIVSII